MQSRDTLLMDSSSSSFLKVFKDQKKTVEEKVNYMKLVDKAIVFYFCHRAVLGQEAGGEKCHQPSVQHQGLGPQSE